MCIMYIMYIVHIMYVMHMYMYAYMYMLFGRSSSLLEWVNPRVWVRSMRCGNSDKSGTPLAQSVLKRAKRGISKWGPQIPEWWLHAY